MYEFTGEAVPIAVAAQAMHKTADFIRYGMQKGLLPIGTAIKQEGCERHDYYISPKLLFEYTGFVYEKALKKAQSPTKVD